MRYFKLSIIFFVVGVAMLTLSSWAAKPLAESTHYSFPQSLFQHYIAKKKGFENAVPTTATKKLSAEELIGIETAMIETTAVDINIERINTNDRQAGQIEASFSTPGQNADEPLSVIRDGTRAVLIQTTEAEAKTNSGWINLSLGDEMGSALTVRLPSSIKHLHVRTVSGDFRISGDSTSKLSLDLESKSGDFFTGSEVAPALEDVRVTTVSGTLQAKALSSIDYKSVSGRLNLKSLPPAANIKCQTVSGNCTLFYKEPPSARVNFHTTSGDFKLSFKGETATAEPAHNITLGKGQGLVEANTVSGDLVMSQQTFDLEKQVETDDGQVVPDSEDE